MHMNKKLNDSLEALKKFASDLGHWPFRSEWDSYAKENGYYLYQTIYYHTEKSWEELRKEFGFQKKITRYTKDDCIAALKEAAEIYGPTIKRREYNEWAKEKDAPTAMQMVSIFGSYTKAKLAAGLIPNQISGKTFSDEEIIKALIDCSYAKGKLFSESEYEEWRAGRKDIPHIETIRKRFGGIPEAKKSLELDTYIGGENVNQLKEGVWKAYFYEFIRNSLSMESYEQWRKKKDAPSLTALRNHAGGFRKALECMLPVFLDELKKGDNNNEY